MKQLQIGIIGAGVIVRDTHLRIFTENPDKYKVTCICDTDTGKAKALVGEKLDYPVAIETDYKAMVHRDDVEVVLVAVPPFLAVDAAIVGLEAGKHVFTEKPMGDTEPDAKRLLEASVQAKGTLMVGEQFYFSPAHRALANMARSGNWPYGRPSMVELHQFWKMTPKTIPQFYHSPWRHDPRLTYGYLIEGGCHSVNPLREAFGMPTAIQSRMFSVDPKLGKNDTLIANCLFQGDIAGQITMAYGMHTISKEFIQVYAREGTLSIGAREIVHKPADSEEWTEEILHGFPTDYHAEWDHFHKVLTGEEELEFTPQQSYDDILFMQMLIDAAEKTPPAG